MSEKEAVKKFTLRLDLCLISTDEEALQDCLEQYNKWVRDRIAEGMSVNYSNAHYNRSS